MEYKSDVKFLHYFKRITEKDMVLEVIVDASVEPGQVVDVNVHPVDYKLPGEEIIT